MRGTNQTPKMSASHLSAFMATVGTIMLASSLTPVVAQRQIDEPSLSPMLFGPTKEEDRDKIRQDQEDQEQAAILTAEQERDANLLDDPNTRPVFGISDSSTDDNLTASRITLGEEDNNRGFFGVLTFLVPDETNLSIGVGPVYKPDYFGSNNYEFSADPQVYVKFRNFVFLDDDGLDFGVFGFSGFRFGPTIRIKGRRDQDDNPALAGLGDVDTTFEFGGFAATTFLDRFAVKAKVRHGLKTGHRGTIVDGYLTALIFRAGPVSVSTSGHASWIGNRYADAYFSVTPEQSAATSGRIAAYDTDAGFRNVGGSVNAYINIRDRWSLNPYASYSLIFDDYADTPIISQYGSRHQYSVGFHLMREFTFGSTGQ